MMTTIAAQYSYLEQYLPIAVYIIIVLITGVVMLGLSFLLGPKNKIAGKGTPYECGVPVLGEARQRFSIRFYLVAILFVLFDIETVFLIPWAVTYKKLLVSMGPVVIYEMLLFIGILFTGYIYAWRRGGLDWD
tara:strand:- start:61 stop:459 length:399 start_codon:yes stop_codon:yes gene_type:complete